MGSKLTRQKDPLSNTRLIKRHLSLLRLWKIERNLPPSLVSEVQKGGD